MSDISQAAANKNTNKEALGAQGDDSDGSAASHTTAQLRERAAFTIQRRERQRRGRSVRVTLAKVDSLVRQAQDQAAASGTRLTTNYTLLEPLPIHNNGGGSDDGSMSGLSADGASLVALPADFRQTRKKRTAPTNAEDNDKDKDNDDNDNDGDGKMQAPGALTQPTGTAGGPSVKNTTHKDVVQPPPNLDDLPDDR